MLVVIDESGCPSFKTGASEYFLMAMVIIDDFSEAERISRAIDETRDRINLRREFKFSSCKEQAKDCFFQEIRKYKFSVRCFVVDKTLIYEEHLRQNPKRFYNFCLKMLLKYDNGRLHNAIVKIDGSGSSIFRQSCAAYLRKEVPQGKISAVKFKDSRSDNLIQLADMVVSAIARPYNSPDKGTPDRWKQMLGKKIENEWKFN